jgi:hypothetical protein
MGTTKTAIFNALCDLIANSKALRLDLAEEAEEADETEHAIGLRRNSRAEVRSAASVILAKARQGCALSARTVAYAVDHYDAELCW